MTFTVVSTDQTAPYIVNPAALIFLLSGVTCTGPTGLLAMSSLDTTGVNTIRDMSLNIFGQIVVTSIGLDLYSSVAAGPYCNNNSIYLSSSALIAANYAGIILESGTGNRIVNMGEILSGAGTGIRSYGGSFNSIVNGGTIASLSGSALDIGGRVPTDAESSMAITNLAGGRIFSNAAGAGTCAILFNGESGRSTLDNHGEIFSLGGYGILMAAVSAGAEPITIRNSGTISGGAGAIAGSVNADLIRNSGTLVGNVSLYDGADELRNWGGTIEGDLALGAGNDLYQGRSGTVLGTVSGEEGDDRFIGNAARADIFDGGAGSDLLDFRFDTAVSLALDNSFEAGGAAFGDSYTGFERVLGSSQNDMIRGDAEVNALMGGGGRDSLDGAAENDALTGGAGIDQLTGGLGNDSFRFLSPGECGDVITDFHNVTGDNDRFQIDADAFGGGLAAGALARADFCARADNLAQDANDRFVFRTTDRTLWFDADGSGAGAAVMVADLQAGATMTAADIQLI